MAIFLDLEEIRKDGSETEAGRLSAPPPIGAMGYRRALQEFTNRRAWRALQQHRQRVFDQILEGGEELRANGPVDGSVIAGQGAAHHGRDRERAVLDHRPLLAGADRQDAAMRRVDDGGEIADPEHAEIGNRKRAALKLFELQFACPGARREVLGLVRDCRR